MKHSNSANVNKITIPEREFFRIGDVAEILGVKPYVIRFWETEFPVVAPPKSESGQRVYRKSQIEALVLIQHLLHVEKYSIEGARRRMAELRKTGTLKATVNSIVSGASAGDESAPQSEADQKTSSSEQPANPGLKIAELKNKIAELRMMIRDPGQLGLTVPGLSLQDFDSEPVPSEPKVQG